jgi:hypothetical protein
MYQTHNSLSSDHAEAPGHFDLELPDALEHWSLDDFEDLVPVCEGAS